ncbi:MAG: O-antigen ligase family protein [Candidatus Delongbacteria bacterium]|jgi:hypothetical protein|nr:O-antigen ligase family protein [Candidatus Delongbacteria bacterium]
MFDLRGGDKMLASFLMFYAVIYILSNQEKKLMESKFLSFEKYLITYLFLAIGLLFLHYELGNITQNRKDSLITLHWTAFLVFFFIRYAVSKEFVSSLLRLVIYMGVSTSIIGTVQFFMWKFFFRVGSFNVAFEGYYRSSGLFLEPGSHGIFLTMAMYTVFFAINNKKIKWFLILFFAFNIALIFSRGIWLGFIVCYVIHYLYFYTNIHRKSLIIAVGVILLVILAPFLYNLGKKDLTQTSNVMGRVFEDTMSARMMYYSYTIKAIPEKLLIGFGDTLDNPHYFAGMVAINQGLKWSMGKEGGIHNLILEEAYLRGVICTIIFIMFFLAYFSRSLSKSQETKSYIHILPAYFVIAYFVYNFTVSGFLISYSGFMTVFLAGVSAGIHHKKIDLSEFKFKEPQKMKRLKGNCV